MWRFSKKRTFLFSYHVPTCDCLLNHLNGLVFMHSICLCFNLQNLSVVQANKKIANSVPLLCMDTLAAPTPKVITFLCGQKFASLMIANGDVFWTKFITLWLWISYIFSKQSLCCLRNCIHFEKVTFIVVSNSKHWVYNQSINNICMVCRIVSS